MMRRAKHEAAHACFALQRGDRCSRLEATPARGSASIHPAPVHAMIIASGPGPLSKEDRAFLRSACLQFLAGPAADAGGDVGQMLEDSCDLRGVSIEWTTTDDHERAEFVARRLGAHWDDFATDARGWYRRSRYRVQVLARELLRRDGLLVGSQIERALLHRYTPCLTWQNRPRGPMACVIIQPPVAVTPAKSRPNAYLACESDKQAGAVASQCC